MLSKQVVAATRGGRSSSPARGSLAYPAALVWGLAGVYVQQSPRSSLIGLLAAGVALALAAAAAWTVARLLGQQHAPA